MFDDSPARSQSAAPSGVDADYDAIHATIVATERGRWFLDEYARRYGGADTERVLAAIAQIEQAIAGGSATEPADAVRREFTAIVAAIRPPAARPPSPISAAPPSRFKSWSGRRQTATPRRT